MKEFIYAISVVSFKRGEINNVADYNRFILLSFEKKISDITLYYSEYRTNVKYL